MTIDEELDVLDTQLRRLKIEYDIFFSNPAKRPPTDIEWKVLSLIRKFSDGAHMKFAQRYRYNEMAQRYAVQSDLWRKKMRIREEGYRRPQDAVLSVQGVRVEEGRQSKFPTVYGVRRKPQAEGQAPETEGGSTGAPPGAFSVDCSEVSSEREKVKSLYSALTAAKQDAGEKVSGSFDSFAAFLAKKTHDLRQKHGCDAVRYSVELENGHVKLKAKAKS